MPNRRFRRGIYLLPTLFTVGNIFCGFSSMLFAARGDFGRAAILIVIAGILDALDGRIARLTGTTSEFGLEFDSLADIVSFGTAPAFLAYRWALVDLGRLGWVVAFLYVVCAAMRLARFNIRSADGSRRFFAGLPSPPAAGLIACIVFAFPEPPASSMAAIGASVVVLLGAVLMISKVRYRSFKEIDLRNRRSYMYVLAIAAILAAILLQPRESLLILACAYVLSGPTAYLWGLVVRLVGGKATVEDSGASPSEATDGPATR
jgi:CDP-diacylglycerol--serine O-phosphatidyltransferase